MRRERRQEAHQTRTPEALAEVMPSPDWPTAEGERKVVQGQRPRQESWRSPGIEGPRQWIFPRGPEEENHGKEVSQPSQ